jgi:hypothetical protein
VPVLVGSGTGDWFSVFSFMAPLSRPGTPGGSGIPPEPTLSRP